MKILVTGGAGYVGTELVRALAESPAVSEILVYDNLSRRAYGLFLGAAPISGRVKFLRGDLLDTRALRKAAKGVDAIVHLAARVSTPFADHDAHSFEQVNHWGTAELGYVAADLQIPRLIYLSSTSVYGDTADAPADLATAPTPRTAYGISKLAGERALAPYAEVGSLITVRCANVYGFSPSLRFDAVINKMLFDALFTRKITQEGSGRQFRAFASVSGVASALRRLAIDGADPGVYHLVERNLSVADVTGAITEILPDTDVLYVAQDMPRRHLQVLPDPRLTPAGDLGLEGFSAELQAFIERFSFGR